MFNIWGGGREGAETGRELKLCHPTAPGGLLSLSDGGLGLAGNESCWAFPLPQVRRHVQKEIRGASTVPASIHVLVALRATQTAA